MKRFFCLLSIYLALVSLGLFIYLRQQHRNAMVWYDYTWAGAPPTSPLGTLPDSRHIEPNSFDEFHQVITRLIHEASLENRITNNGASGFVYYYNQVQAKPAEHRRFIHELKTQLPQSDWVVQSARYSVDLEFIHKGRRFALCELVGQEFHPDSTVTTRAYTMINLGTPYPPYSISVGGHGPFIGTRRPSVIQRADPIFPNVPPRSEPAYGYWALPIPAWPVLLVLFAIPFCLVYLLRRPLARALRLQTGRRAP